MYFLTFNYEIIDENGNKISQDCACKMLNDYEQEIDFLKHRIDVSQYTVDILEKYCNNDFVLHLLHAVLEKVSNGDIVVSSVDENLIYSFNDRQEAQMDLLKYLINQLKE